MAYAYMPTSTSPANRKLRSGPALSGPQVGGAAAGSLQLGGLGGSGLLSSGPVGAGTLTSGPLNGPPRHRPDSVAKGSAPPPRGDGSARSGVLTGNAPWLTAGVGGAGGSHSSASLAKNGSQSLLANSEAFCPSPARSPVMNSRLIPMDRSVSPGPNDNWAKRDPLPWASPHLAPSPFAAPTPMIYERSVSPNVKVTQQERRDLSPWGPASRSAREMPLVRDVPLARDVPLGSCRSPAPLSRAMLGPGRSPSPHRPVAIRGSSPHWANQSPYIGGTSVSGTDLRSTSRDELFWDPQGGGVGCIGSAGSLGGRSVSPRPRLHQIPCRASPFRSRPISRGVSPGRVSPQPGPHRSPQPQRAARVSPMRTTRGSGNSPCHTPAQTSRTPRAPDLATANPPAARQHPIRERDSSTRVAPPQAIHQPTLSSQGNFAPQPMLQGWLSGTSPAEVTQSSVWGSSPPGSLHQPQPTQRQQAMEEKRVTREASAGPAQVSPAGTPMSPKPSPGIQVASPREDLRAGGWVRIGSCLCQITRALGMGSFGAVWAADDTEGDELAVKEIMCHSHSELLNALFESHLLRVLGGGPAKSSRCSTPMQGRQSNQSTPMVHHRGDHDDTTITEGGCAGLVPSLMACDTTRVGAETWRVRLAMTRIHGEPLDIFLEQQRYRQQASDSGPLTPCQQLAEACFYAQELLTQLIPAFEQIAACALHRDVNSHNILIDVASSAGTPRYGLVDFGLAVDSVCWCSEEGSGAAVSRPSRVGRDGASTWHYLDVGGDCRYWPLSAWLQFLAGWRELEARPPLSFEYQHQLDLHALGITALQVFAELMLPLPEACDAGEDGDGGARSLPKEITTLREAWERYWRRVSPLHSRLIHTFQKGGDWDALKMDFIENHIDDKIADDLTAMRKAIRDASEACQRICAQEAGDRVPACAPQLFAALLGLVSNGQGEATLHGAAAWRAVRAVLPDGDEPGTPHKVPKTAGISSCSTASSVGHQADAAGRDVSYSGRSGSGGRSPAQESRDANAQAGGSMPVLLLPRPRRVCQGEVSPIPRARTPTSNMAPTLEEPAVAMINSPVLQIPEDGEPPRKNLVERLSHLKDKVDWLALEMAKLGDKGETQTSRRQTG